MHICKCIKCSSPTPKNDSYFLHGNSYCGDCIESARITAGANASAIQREIDFTVCSRCGRDSGEGEWGTTDGVPLCESCATNQQVAALPWWLKNSIALFAVLLVFSVVHGWSYISSVRSTYAAEKRLAKGDNKQAVALLDPVVERYGECDRCVLDLAIALVRDGHSARGYKIDQDHGAYDEHLKYLADELQSEYDKVDAAGKLLDEVEKLHDDDKYPEARAKMAEAARIYPNWEIYPAYNLSLDADEAFFRKDWDSFLAFRKQQFESDSEKDAFVTAGYANALAVKYASSNDESFRRSALQRMEEAKRKAKGNDEAEKFMVEFLPRFEYRLKTREIISKTEFDRRFRPELAKTEKSK